MAGEQAAVRISADGSKVLVTYDQIGKAAETATARITRAGEAANSNTARVVSGLNNAFASARKNVSNLSFQLQDIAVQAQSGTSWSTILIQQGTQIASVFGPGGAVVGAVGAGLGLVAGFLLSAGDEAETAKEKSYEFGDALDYLGKVAVTTSGHLGDLIEKYRKASEAAQTVTRLQLEAKASELEDQVAARRSDADALLGKLPTQRYETVAGGFIVGNRPQSYETAIQGNIDAIRRFAEGGSIAAAAEDLDQLARRAEEAGNTDLRDLAKRLLDAATASEDLQAQLRGVKDQLAAIGSVDAGVPFPLSKPDDIPVERGSSRGGRRGSRGDRRSPGPFAQAELEGARQADFQADLKAEIEATRTRIIQRNQLEQRGLQERNSLRLQAERESMTELKAFDQERAREEAQNRPIYDPLTGAQTKFAELADSSKQYGRIIGDGIAAGANFASQAFATFVTEGKAGLADLAKAAANQALTGIFSLLINAGIGGLGQQLFGSPATGSTGASPLTYGGPRAGGGGVDPRRWYWVGEKGPEKFYPGQAGHIQPNGAGGGVKVTNQIIDQRGAGAPPVETESRQGPDGMVHLRTLIRSELAAGIARGGGEVGGAMKGAYGARRKGRR